MIETIQDPYLVDALGYAMNHSPCVVACSTLRALDMIHSYLQLVHKPTSYIRASLPSEMKIAAFNDFEQGRTDYLVTTTQILFLGGFRFVREGVCIASSEHLTMPMYIQIAGRIGAGALDLNRLFLKGPK